MYMFFWMSDLSWSFVRLIWFFEVLAIGKTSVVTFEGGSRERDLDWLWICEEFVFVLSTFFFTKLKTEVLF